MPDHQLRALASSFPSRIGDSARRLELAQLIETLCPRVSVSCAFRDQLDETIEADAGRNLPKVNMLIFARLMQVFDMILHFEVARPGLALDLDDAIGDCRRYSIPNLDDSINAGFQVQRIPDTTHIADDAMYEGDAFVASHAGMADQFVLCQAFSSLLGAVIP